MKMNSIHILLVEDNEGDILLIREALEDGKIVNDLSVVNDGEKAIRYLSRDDGYKDAVMPNLILLDINLPRKNGHEVLAFIKNSDELKHIPVIMLTTSSSDRDIMESYKNHANCYITKPVEVADFMDAVTSIEEFWVNLVQFPIKK